MPGSYIIRPVEAKLNDDARFNTAMTPLCTFTFGAKTFTSDPAKLKGKNPTWKDSIEIYSDADASTNLRLDLVENRDFSSKDLLGNASINLKEIEDKGKLRNWYPLRWNNKEVGEILLESRFEEDRFNKGKDQNKDKGMSKEKNWDKGMGMGKDKNFDKDIGMGKDKDDFESKNYDSNKKFVSQADASDRSRINESSNKNEISQGNFVREGMMTEQLGRPFMMSDKQREMYNNNAPQGMNENMDKFQWNQKSEVDQKLAGQGQFRASDQTTKGGISKFGDNIGTNPNPIKNDDLSGNRQDDLEGKKPGQQTTLKNELNNQGRGEARAEGGLSKTDGYSQGQSHIGNKMNIGLIERQNQPQKLNSGMNASAEGLNRDASPSKEKKITEGKLSKQKENEERESGGSMYQEDKSKKSKQEKVYWDNKIEGLSKAEDEFQADKSGKKNLSGDKKSGFYKDREQKDLSEGLTTNYAGGSSNQKLTGQDLNKKVDLKNYDM